MRIFALILFCCLPQFSFAQKIFTIPSTNNLLLDANMYQAKNANSKAPLKVMLLCHQARYSKGEYVETAPQFAKMGYTCIAISQRSGDSVNGVVNTTARAARAKNLPTEYIDAEQDIISALNFVFSKYKQPIILVGSSYSSSLILKIAKQFPEKVKATISFSPGEYFADSTIITKSLEAIRMPVYITCSKEEIQET